MISADAEPKITKSAANLHRANRSLSRTKAETQFIREASCNDFSPLSHNSHLYHLKQRKHETLPGSVWLTICHRGIEIYDRNKHHDGATTDKFQWNDIGRLTFDVSVKSSSFQRPKKGVSNNFGRRFKSSQV